MDFPDNFEEESDLPMIVSRLMADAEKVAADFGTSTVLGHLLMAYCASAGGARRIRGMGADPVSMRETLSEVLAESVRTGNHVGSGRSLDLFLKACRNRSDDLICDEADTAMMDTHPNGVILSLIARTSGSCAVTEAVMSSGGLSHLLPQADDYDHLESELDMLLDCVQQAEPVTEFPQRRAADDPGMSSEPVRTFFDNLAGQRKPGIRSPESALDDIMPSTPPRPAPPRKDTGSSNHLSDNPGEALDRAIRKLSRLAEEGSLDPVHGRDAEIAHIMSVLKRRKKSSIILHGESGVGKTSIVEGLAMAMRRADADPALASRPVYEVSLSGLVSGSRFRGDFEGRITEMIRRAVEEKAILFIDEIHNIVGAGASGSRSNDGANILKPALARGDITIIGATTSREARVMRSDETLMRRFDMLHIREPSADETREILRRSAWGYTTHHRISASPVALDEIIRICDAFMPGKRFPDKAFDLLDMGSVVAREESASDLSALHVRTAALRLGVRLPEPPSKDLRARLTALDVDLDVEVDLRPRIGRAARSAVMRGARRGAMAAWGIVSKDADCALRLGTSLAETLDLPYRSIDLSSVRDLQNISLLIGQVGRNESADPPGELVAIGDGASETVVLFTGVEACHPTATRLLAEMCATGCIIASDGRSIDMSGTWALFDVRSDGSGRIGFGDAAADGPHHAARKSLGEALSGCLTEVWEVTPDQSFDRAGRAFDDLLAGLAPYGVLISCDADLRTKILSDLPASISGRQKFLSEFRSKLCDQIMRLGMVGPATLTLRDEEPFITLS